MKTNSLITLLRLFSAEDLHQWQVFLQSPFFQVPPKLVRLGGYLVECWPEFLPQQVSPQTLFRILYPEGEPFRQQQVYDSCSQLLQQTHSFLTHQSLRSDATFASPILLRQLSGRQAKDQIQRQLKASRSTRKNPLFNQDAALTQMLVSHEATLWVGRQQTREQDVTLEEVMRHTDQYYLLSRLKYTCEWLNRSNILPKDERQDNPLSSFPALDLWPAHYFEEPLLALYRSVFDMLRHDDPTAFSDLTQMLRRYGGEIGKEEAIGLYAYAQNFCIRMINIGETRYLENLFDLYLSTLEIGLLLEDGELDHRQYKNIVTVGLRLHKYEWVESFLESNKSLLPPQYRENAYVINLASLRYEQQRYHEALVLLQQLAFTDVYYQLTARVMMLKIYFEQQEEEALEHLLDTFRMFLQRNKEISGYQRQVHLNLVRYTKKLHQVQTASYRLSPQQVSSRLRQLDAQVSETGNMTNLGWLRSQIASLEARYNKDK